MIHCDTGRQNACSILLSKESCAKAVKYRLLPNSMRAMNLFVAGKKRSGRGECIWAVQKGFSDQFPWLYCRPHTQKELVVMKAHARFMVSLPILTALAACSGDSSTPASGLAGSWIDACAPVDQTFTTNKKLVVSGDRFDLTNTLYTGQCAEPAVALTFSGILIEGTQVEVPGRGIRTDIDIVNQAKTEVWYLQADIDNFNTAARCGISNWAIGVSVDVSTCPDAVSPVPIPSTIYDIYLVAGNELFLSAGDSSNNPDQRPVELSTTADYVRQ